MKKKVKAHKKRPSKSRVGDNRIDNAKDDVGNKTRFNQLLDDAIFGVKK